MTARFRDVQVRVSKPEHAIELSCTAENGGPETWRPGDGFAFSYQIFDPSSGTLIDEGLRTPLAADVAPGVSTPLRLSISIPRTPGPYRIYAGLLQENVAWAYQRSSPFVLIDAKVGEGELSVGRNGVSTLSRVRLETLGRSIGRAFWYPVRALREHHSLIRSMVRRDIAGRYRGSYGGLFWTVIHPLLMMLTYYFVFGIVLRARFGNDPRPSSFLLYFLAGMLPWLAFSEALGRAASVILEHHTFVKKLVFPVEILPVNLAIAGLVSEAFGAAIFAAGLWYFGWQLSLSVLYLPLLLVPQLLLTLGLCWFLAALGVFFRDIGQIIGFLLTLWFFVTPICYPVESLQSLPRGWLRVFAQNPLYILVGNYRLIFLEGSPPDWRSLAKLALVSAVIFVAGHAWFYKLRRSFADLL